MARDIAKLDDVSVDEIDRLGCRLFEEMERLDPSLAPVDWDALSEREHEFYRLCVLAVLSEVRCAGV